MERDMRICIQHLVHLRPHLASLIDLISYSPIRVRKALLTLARCQRIPPETPPDDLKTDTEWYMLHDDLVHLIPPAMFIKGIPAPKLITFLQDFVSEFQSPSLSGFISMIIRNLPSKLEDKREDVSVELERGIQKEMEASLGIFHPRSFEWDQLFNAWRTTSTGPIAEDYPCDSVLQSRIAKIFHSTKQKFEGLLLYPDYSTKTIGRQGAINLRCVDLSLVDIPIHHTTEGLERLYSRLGLKICGPTEVRWAYKYNDLRPRVYFARGPDQYYPSRYIQQIFNIIIDSFPMTHRFGRFLTDVIRCEPEGHLFIYDYSSFTSKLHEIRNFTSALARFYSGVSVRVVDTFEGILDVDLGQMLDDFNQACNMSPLFDVGILNLDQTYRGEEIHTHNCGMLGVPGNISSCTLLHGLHLSILTASLVLSKVIGDDAIGSQVFETEFDRMDFIQKLKNIGDLSVPKMAWWGPGPEFDDNTDYTWHYTKRPIFRSGPRAIIGWQPVFPPFGILFRLEEPFRTTSHSPTRLGHVRKMASMLSSFTIQFEGHLEEIDSADLEFIETFVLWIRISIRRYSEKNGIRDIPVMPYSLGIEGIEEMINQLSGRIIRLPVKWTGVYDRRDEVFQGRYTKSVKLGVDLGWIEAERMQRWVLADDFVDDLRLIFLGTFRSVYNLSFSYDCPHWLKSLVDAELSLQSPLIVQTEDPYDFIG